MPQPCSVSVGESPPFTERQGARVGYGRVSTTDQDSQVQLLRLEAAGCIHHRITRAMTRLLSLAASAALFAAAPALATPAPLVIGACVYRLQSTAGAVRTFLHTCHRTDNVDEPIAVDCRTRKVASYVDEGFIIPGRGGKAGWQPGEAFDPNSTDPSAWLLIEAACS